MSDLVSIITPTYNSVQYIAETVASIQAQTYKNWELLITDDGSTDETLQILADISKEDARIQVFQLSENGGPAKARNHSIEKAKGRYIAFLDSDDVWYPNKLTEQIILMTEKQAGFCYGSFDVRFEEGPVVDQKHVAPTIDYKGLLLERAIGCLTAIYDTKIYGKVLMPDIKKRQDYGLWLHLLRIKSPAVGIQHPIALYRKRKQSVSSNPAKSAYYVWKVYYGVEKLGVLKSTYYFVLYSVRTLWQALRRQIKRQIKKHITNKRHGESAS